MSNESKAPTRIAAAAMFLLLIGTGYAITPSLENATDPAPVTVAALTPSFVEAEQWTGDEHVNVQWSGDEEVGVRFAVLAEDHIQAF